MEDTYTHSSFTLLQTTELIREVVDHVLRQSGPEVPQELRSDLASWRDGQRGEGGRQRGMKEENSSSESVEDVTSNIPFDLVKRAHKQLAKTPLGGCIHVLLSLCTCTLSVRLGIHVCPYSVSNQVTNSMGHVVNGAERT